MISKDELLEAIGLCKTTEDYLRIVRKYFIHGTPYVFQDNENKYYDFRSRIANKWSVGFQEVLILGSGKLGYSYHKDSKFSIESDIDVAIVNERLFEEFYMVIRDFQYSIQRGLVVLSLNEKQMYNEFLKYMIKGWMRPDKLPPQIIGEFSKNNWFEYFESISYENNLAGNYKVSAGLFKNFNYMELYYVNSLMSL